MGSLFNQKSSFTLKSEDLSVAGNSVGICNALNTDFTWNNVNMKQILGDQYDKYDEFNISFAILAVGYTGATYGFDAGDRLVNLNMSGLNFKNNCYNVATQSNLQSVNLYSYLFNNSTTSGVSAQMSNDSLSFTFKKAENVDISLYYTRAFKNAGGNYTIATANKFPPIAFTFKITGIPREVEQKFLNLK